MQKLEGDGMAFVHAGGYVIEKELMPGEVLKVDTGCVVAYTQQVDFDVEFVRGVRNLVFGGRAVLRSAAGAGQGMAPEPADQSPGEPCAGLWYRRPEGRGQYPGWIR